VRLPSSKILRLWLALASLNSLYVLDVHAKTLGLQRLLGVIWHTTHDSIHCVGAPQHTRKLHMTLPVRAPMLSSARKPSRYGSSRMPLHPLLHVMILPVHALHSCLVSSARSCIIGMFAAGKMWRTVANNTVFLASTYKLDKLARSRLTANWVYSHSCPVCVKLPRTACYFHQINRARGIMVLSSRLAPLSRCASLRSRRLRDLLRETRVRIASGLLFFGLSLIILLSWVL
jgi:hypothetical protein